MGILGDPENFIPANPLVTPVHIQPEWYFLIAYAILRSIPNKLGGVIALAISIVILLIWLGARPVEDPYIFLGQVLSLIYFLYYFISFFFTIYLRYYFKVKK